MDWKSSLFTFAIIFLAELGDKTQLMIMSMSARSRSPHMVFFGAVAALMVSSLIAVIAGDAVLRAIPLRLIRLSTGVGFMGIGAMLIARAYR